MQKNETNGKAASALDIDGYRELCAVAVGLEVSELIANQRDDANMAMLRKIATCILADHDKLPVADIARILNESESWTRYSIDDIQRRISRYRALSLRVERMTEVYALACVRAGKPASGATASGVAIESYRRRIAGAIGVTVIELVEFQRDNDEEILQKVAAYLLLSKEGLALDDAAKVMGRSQQWALSAQGYVERNLKRGGNQGLKDFVAKTAAACGIGGSKFLESRIP